jgi:hypothetical protein
LVLLGLTIESEYHLERDKDSDFLKSIPHKTNGRDAIDLEQKAWMLGGLLAGDVRSTTETIADPVDVVAALNRIITGRGNAQATCLSLRILVDALAGCARITADGEVSTARTSSA